MELKRKTSTFNFNLNLNYKTLKQIYSLKIIILNIGIFVLFYFIFNFFIKYQNRGVFLINVPLYIIYLAIATSSILTSISIATVLKTIRTKSAIAGVGFGTFTSVLSGIITGCGCSFPLLISIFSLFGLNSTYALFFNTFFVNNAFFILFAISIINILTIVYLIGQFNNKINCKIKSSKSLNKKV
ncbi:MAG: hypothetical protein M1168_03415 [Candidatus Marsarchaeota archaeon]|nr:hypothetical protein [Candidatus Marsarchaeota archaeon]MCL5095003.1 hypothetical protein [Candidatus Marsarchaeota archaeon]